MKYEGIGIATHDVANGRDIFLNLNGSWNGWIFYHNGSSWYSVKKATEDEIEKIIASHKNMIRLLGENSYNTKYNIFCPELNTNQSEVE